MTNPARLSQQAHRAHALVSALQAQFVSNLESVANALELESNFSLTEWLRDGGQHGGGIRFSSPENELFNRASVNISQIHYADQPEKKLASATAISTIIHPQNPHAPSVHIHISWTEMKDGSGYWRLMADLNPAIDHPLWKNKFQEILRSATPEYYQEASAQGDRYFYIPALERHRGASHFYLEQFNSGDHEADFCLAQRFGKAVIDGYAEILQSAIAQHPEVSHADREAQLSYHTLYLFQVLTLDRGTTSGLLVHDQNDIGIMGSIPARVNPELLASWADRCPPPQDQLVKSLVHTLHPTNPSEVDDQIKAQLAATVRAHYQTHPEALCMQAQGNIIPPTVDNHQ